MKRLSVFLAAALLVAGGLYLTWPSPDAPMGPALAETGKPAGQDAPKSVPSPKSAPTQLEDGEIAPPGVAPVPLDAPGVPAHQDISKLPEPVRATIEAMAEVAKSGEIAGMQRVLEMNELPPIVTRGKREGAISYWRKISADGNGRDVLAALLETLDAGYAIKKDGGQDMYVWPYFAETKLEDLSPAQQVDLFRLLTPEEVKTMKASGGYLGWRVGIGADGTWHYFLKGK